MIAFLLAALGLCRHPEGTQLRRFDDGTFYVCWTCG